MAQREVDIVHLCMIQASKSGAVLMKNVRGMFLTLCGTRKIRAGLAMNGSSDLIGWKSVVITPDMVGKKIAIYTAIEIKTAKGNARPEQKVFIDNVLKAGGIAGIARNENDVKNLLD